MGKIFVSVLGQCAAKVTEFPSYSFLASQHGLGFLKYEIQMY